MVEFYDWFAGLHVFIEFCLLSFVYCGLRVA